MRKYIILLLVLFLIPARASQAQEAKLIFPLACTYGKDCWAVNYLDVREGEGVQDFECNQKSYDGHKGTDFALGSILQMKKGIDVLAAADGVVLRLRDGQSDHLKSKDELDAIMAEKKECGNGILIDHGHGLNIFYCQLKQGSISVKPKQKVSAGEKIAEVGQSGLAEFPHLHFGVTQNGKLIDPYTGLSAEDGCGEIKDPLWHNALNIKYDPVAIFDGGFNSNTPDFKQINRDGVKPAHIPLSSAAFVFWAGFFNIEKGDVITMTILDPKGEVFDSRYIIADQTRTRQYYFTGRKIGKAQLMQGTYTAHVQLQRETKGASINRDRSFIIEVTP